MVIQKEIDLKALQNVLEDAMQSAIVNCDEVRINLIEANDIVAVIKEARKSEIQDKLKPIQMPSNIREEIKNNCFGTYDNDDIECQCCDSKKGCERKEKEMKNVEGASKCECFGSHINGNGKCNLCIYEKFCMIETEVRNEKNEKN